MTSFRDRTTAYIQKKYGGKIESPWMRFPEYGVFRHAYNQKWYVLFMALPGNRLGFQGDEICGLIDRSYNVTASAEREGALPV